MTRRARPLASVVVGLAAASCVLVSCAGATEEEPDAPIEAPSAPTRWAIASTPSDRALLEAPARAVAGPGAQARVAPPFAARVVSIAVAPGDVVAEGDVLLVVTMPDVLDAAAVWTSTGSRLSLRRQRRGELEALRQEGLVEQSRVFEQQTSLAELGAERARALAVLHAAGVTPSRAAAALARGSTAIVSPIAGVVSAVDARIGEVRDPSGTPLVEVLGSAPARIEARLARALPDGAELVFLAADGRSIDLSERPDASAIDPADGTRLVWISPRAPVALPDGLRGTLRARVVREGVVGVPALAIGRAGAEAFVVRRAGDRAERVPVRVLASGGGSAIVEGTGAAGLAPGDAIATDVAVLLRAPEVEE
jgi:cobalt-zinc-cadmium efflux system membrane fusion protein